MLDWAAATHELLFHRNAAACDLWAARYPALSQLAGPELRERGRLKNYRMGSSELDTQGTIPVRGSTRLPCVWPPPRRLAPVSIRQALHGAPRSDGQVERQRVSHH
jgi:hypothetical protein